MRLHVAEISRHVYAMHVPKRSPVGPTEVAVQVQQAPSLLPAILEAEQRELLRIWNKRVKEEEEQLLRCQQHQTHKTQMKSKTRRSTIEAEALSVMRAGGIEMNGMMPDNRGPRWAASAQSVEAEVFAASSANMETVLTALDATVGGNKKGGAVNAGGAVPDADRQVAVLHRIASCVLKPPPQAAADHPPASPSNMTAAPQAAADHPPAGISNKTAAPQAAAGRPHDNAPRKRVDPRVNMLLSSCVLAASFAIRGSVSCQELLAQEPGVDSESLAVRSGKHGTKSAMRAKGRRLT